MIPSVEMAAPRILLVEDDDAVRRSLLLLLRSRGYDVRAYPSAVGLAMDPGALSSVILVADLMMPHTDAIELLSELRGASWAGRSILISGHLDARWRARAIAAGYDAVLPKPISKSVLVRTVEELLPKPPVESPEPEGSA